MTLGWIIFTGLVATVIAVSSKLKEHSGRIKGLEEKLKKPVEKKKELK